MTASSVAAAAGGASVQASVRVSSLTRPGYIVTNNHVVEGATEIKVTLATKEEFDATLVGRDPKTDLALIKVKSPKPLPTVPFGNSDALEVGEWVLAIGNPFGLGHTVTSGIVGAKGRIIGAGPTTISSKPMPPLILATVVAHSSTCAGKSIGINTAIVSGGQGIGFAIPINLAKEVSCYNSTTKAVSRVAGWAWRFRVFPPISSKRLIWRIPTGPGLRMSCPMAQRRKLASNGAMSL